MTCKLCVKHKKVKFNVVTGNECRNWKANTLKRHAHSADHKQSVVARGLWLDPCQFRMCLMRKQRVMQPCFVHWTSNTETYQCLKFN